MTETMRGVCYRADRTVEVIDYPKPTPGPGQALIAIKAAAICGSDLHRYRVASSLVAGKEPWVPGHEPAGVVAAVGDCCSHVQVGQRVAIFHWIGCGHCQHCLAGMHQWCSEAQAVGHPAAWGPDADYMVVPEKNCLPLPDDFTFEDGALIACIAGTGYAAMRKLQPSGEDVVAVFGQGPVGLMGGLLAKAYGARVIGLDLSSERLALAKALGLDWQVNVGATDAAQAVRELTNGLGAHAALETSGSAGGHQGVIDALRRGGRAVFVGFGAQGPTVNLTHIIGKQLTLMGSHVMPIHYYWDLVTFIRERNLQPRFRQLVTHRFPLEEAAEAYRIADEAHSGKVMLVMD